MKDKFSPKNIFDELAEKWFSRAKEDLFWAMRREILSYRN